jgi:hypothetical protein
MRYTTFKCDECGALKKQTNHWWVVKPRAGVDGDLIISPMTPNLPDETVTVCGRECAQKAIERWMGEVTRLATQAEMAPATARSAVPPVSTATRVEISDIARARESRRRRLSQASTRSAAVAQQARRAS